MPFLPSFFFRKLCWSAFISVLLQIQVRRRIYVYTVLAPVSLFFCTTLRYITWSQTGFCRRQTVRSLFFLTTSNYPLCCGTFSTLHPWLPPQARKGCWFTQHDTPGKVTSPVQTKPLHYLTHSHFLTCAVWVLTFDSNERVTQHFKKTTHTRKLSEKKMGTSIDLSRHVDIPSFCHSHQ